MAYQNDHTWWLEGPQQEPCGGGLSGIRGLGQSCPSGFSMDATGTCSQSYCDFPYVMSNGVCVTGASIIPGVPDSYVYIGGAILAGALLFGGLLKR